MHTQMCFVWLLIASGAIREISGVFMDKLESIRNDFVGPHRVIRRNRTIAGPSEDLALCEEPVFLRIDGMCLHFHYRLARQGEDLLQPRGGFQRRQREEEIGQAVAPGQSAVDDPTIDAVVQTLLAALEGKISPHYGSRRQQVR